MVRQTEQHKQSSKQLGCKIKSVLYNLWHFLVKLWLTVITIPMCTHTHPDNKHYMFLYLVAYSRRKINNILNSEDEGKTQTMFPIPINVFSILSILQCLRNFSISWISLIICCWVSQYHLWLTAFFFATTVGIFSSVIPSDRSAK